MKHRRTRTLGDLLRRSRLAHAILARSDRIGQRLLEENRKVWPTAQVARLFGISERLLWKWIKEGVLPAFRPPTDRHRVGIATETIRDFLRRLARDMEPGAAPGTCRARPAEARCREEMRGLGRGKELSPRQFAEAAGVSVSTVHRCLQAGLLSSRRPTDHRIRISIRGKKRGKNC